MISPNYVRTMAAHNAWQSDRLCAAARAPMIVVEGRVGRWQEHCG